MKSAVLAVVSMALLAGCGSHAESTAKSPAAPDAPTIAVARAEPEDLARNMVLTAEFIPYQDVDVMAKMAGYIKSITVDIGDRVKSGQLLATLEIPELADETRKATAAVDRSQAQMAQARDEVKRAESTHQIAHLSYERLANVLKSRPGLVAQQEVDDAQAKDAAAEAQIGAARSNLVAAEQEIGITKAEVARLDTITAYTRITAPFDGVVTKRYADLGSMIQAGTSSQSQARPVVRVAEDSVLRLILPVPESAVPTVHVGQLVEVRVPTLNRNFPGKVARFATTVAVATRTMDTEVDVQNPGLVLIPGMYAEVSLQLEHSAAALSVPVTAVDIDTAGVTAPQTGMVMVVDSGNRLEKRNVAIGMETANRIEIRSGIAKGEMVVVGSRAGLEAGAAVQPKLTEMEAAK